MRILTILSTITVLFAAGSFAGTLQDAYDSCGPGNGYDKYLELAPHQTYTGGLTVDSGVDSCIVGNYAKVNRDGNTRIEANGNNTVLDIDHLIVYGSSINAGIYYSNGAEGLVDFCTVCDNYFGIMSVGNVDLTVKNSIVANNDNFGICWWEDYPATITYCDAWGNSGGNYMDWCDG
ncbi:MAG: hypothetical protein GY771_04040 [bacterium]|nr:hypothetical protein [bacterium]